MSRASSQICADTPPYRLRFRPAGYSAICYPLSLPLAAFYMLFNSIHILSVYSMGSLWSSYAGSTDIASFATLENDEKTQEYDYIVCGGQPHDRWKVLYSSSRWNRGLCDSQSGKFSAE